jgi:glyoxylase-like metal-dependent hydrolase (beta-lactamase superfamily II)
MKQIFSITLLVLFALDHVVVTHPDQDHTGGLITVLDGFINGDRTDH